MTGNWNSHRRAHTHKQNLKDWWKKTFVSVVVRVSSLSLHSTNFHIENFSVNFFLPCFAKKNLSQFLTFLFHFLTAFLVNFAPESKRKCFSDWKKNAKKAFFSPVYTLLNALRTSEWLWTNEKYARNAFCAYVGAFFLPPLFRLCLSRARRGGGDGKKQNFLNNDLLSVFGTKFSNLSNSGNAFNWSYRRDKSARLCVKKRQTISEFSTKNFFPQSKNSFLFMAEWSRRWVLTRWDVK